MGVCARRCAWRALSVVAGCGTLCACRGVRCGGGGAGEIGEALRLLLHIHNKKAEKDQRVEQRAHPTFHKARTHSCHAADACGVFSGPSLCVCVLLWRLIELVLMAVNA